MLEFARQRHAPTRRRAGAAAGLLAGAAALFCLGCADDLRQAGDEQRVVELWTNALRPRFTDYLERQIAAFEADNPDVRVEWIDVPWGEMTRKLTVAAAAGEQPDVVNLAEGEFGRFASFDIFADMRPLAPGDPHARYLAGAMTILQHDGRLLGLPWYLTSGLTYCNAELLDAGGLTPDTIGPDWEDLRSQAGPFREQTGAFLFSIPLGAESMIYPLLKEIGRDPLATGVPQLDTPENIAFVQEWVDAYRAGLLPRAAAVGGHTHLVEHYQSGQIAVMHTGPNFLVRIRDIAPDVYRATELREGVGKPALAVMMLSVLESSDVKEEAAALAWRLTGPEAQLEFCQIVSVLPSTEETLEAPFFQPPANEDELSVEEKVRYIQARQAPSAECFTPPLAAWSAMKRVLEEGMQAALLDGADVGEMLRQVNEEWTRLMHEHGELKEEALASP